MREQRNRGMRNEERGMEHRRKEEYGNGGMGNVGMRE